MAKKPERKLGKGTKSTNDGGPPPSSRAVRLQAGPLRAAEASAVRLGLSTTPRVKTVVYVHGIGNKPVASVLKCQWDHALFPSLPGHADLGDRSRMAYWVNREYYPTPTPGGCAGGDRVTEDLEEAAGPNV